MRIAILLIVVLWMLPMQAQEPAPPALVQVHAERVSKNGKSYFDVTASGIARADPQQTWRVLTDYERMPEFVPDLISSRLVSRTQNDVVVDQLSKLRFLFVSQPVRMVVRMTEQPFSVVDAALVSGDMLHYAAHWELTPIVYNGIDSTRITYAGTMEPDFFVPPLIGKPILQANVKKMVEAVLAEIEKRSAP